MQPDPPVPVDADYDAPSNLLRVTFDRELTPAVLDPANWSLHFAMSRFTCSAAQVFPGDPYTVVGVMVFAAPSIQPNKVSYAPPPFDVISTAALPAAAFANFPVHAPT